jgi:hypothetical protein
VHNPEVQIYFRETMNNTLTLITIATLCLIILLSCSEIIIAKRVHRKLVDEDGDLLEGDLITNTASQQKMKMSFSNQRKGPPIEDEELTPATLKKYKEEERDLRIQLSLAKEQYGRISSKYANLLNQLGRTIYKQERYEEVLETAREIVKIHEELDGPESINTAKALTNVGSTANRLGKLKECEVAMNRALYIFIKEYGIESKEVRLSYT